MQKLLYDININAPKKRVWETMLDDKKYKIWVKAFSENSEFIGKWEEGAEVKFFDPNMGGSIAQLDVFNPHDQIVANHIATLTKENIRETTGPITEKWIGTKETYRFVENNGSTRIEIEMETHEDFVDMFNKCWPQALENIKHLTES